MLTLKKAIVQQLHLNSTRIPKKLLQQVNGVTLLDRGLAYMRYLRDETGCKMYVSCALEDKEIVEACKIFSIEVIPADRQDLDKDTWPECTYYLGNWLQGIDLVWHSNIMCHPFLKIETGLDILRINDPCVLTYEKRGTIWDDGQLACWPAQMADTRRNHKYYEVSHVGYIIQPVYYSLADEVVANYCEPRPIRMSSIERLDIDTPEDLLIAQNLRIDNLPCLHSLDA